MSQDYHIYLHSNEESSLSSNTKPKEETMGGAFSAKSAYNATKTFMNGGFSSAIQSGTAALSKVLPVVAVGVIAVRETDKILSTGFQHLENYTGTYQYSMEYNNFKTIIGNVINPIGYIKKSLHLQFEQNKFNERQREYRTLMGERFIGV